MKTRLQTLISQDFGYKQIINEKSAGRLSHAYLILGKEQGHPVMKEVLGKEAVYAAACRWTHDYGGMFGLGNVVSAAVPAQTSVAPKSVRNVGNVDERNPIWEDNTSGML